MDDCRCIVWPNSLNIYECDWTWRVCVIQPQGQQKTDKYSSFKEDFESLYIIYLFMCLCVYAMLGNIFTHDP